MNLLLKINLLEYIEFR